MTTDRMHITATESRHLCGSLAGGPRSRSLPFDYWLQVYSEDRSRCCWQCRLTARRSADRRRSIDAVNTTYDSPPEYGEDQGTQENAR